MAKQVKRRRGSTTEHDSFVGAQGEITVDTDLNTVIVHDGLQSGGFPLCKADLSNAELANKINVSELSTTDGSAGYILTTDGNGQISFSAPGGVTPNSVGTIELNLSDGSVGQVITTDGAGTINFSSVSVGVDELECVDGTAGQVLTTDGNTNISFTTIDVTGAAVGGDLSGTVSNAQIVPNAVGITELDVNDGTAGQYLTTDGSGSLSFSTDNTNVGDTSVGGDISGTVSNANIVSGSVGITELDVMDGSVGQLLSTNGSGVLSFIPQLTSLALGGDLTGTSDNAVIAAGAVEDSMIVGLDAAKLTGILPALSGANLTGVYNNITTAFATEPFSTNGVRTITGIGFQPSYVICYAGRLMTGVTLNDSSLSVGAGTPTTQITGLVGSPMGSNTSGGVSTGRVAFMQVSTAPLVTKSVVLTSFDSDGITYTTSSSGTGSGGSWRIAFTFFG